MFKSFTTRLMVLTAIMLFAFSGLASAQNPVETLNAPVLNSVTQVGNSNSFTFNVTFPEQSQELFFSSIIFYAGRNSSLDPISRTCFRIDNLDSYTAGSTVDFTVQVYNMGDWLMSNLCYFAVSLRANSSIDSMYSNVLLSPLSNSVAVEIGEVIDPRIEIGPYESVQYIHANIPYNFNLNATINANIPIIYTLYDAPEGMTIDAATGLVSWTPTVPGLYDYAIGCRFAGSYSENISYIRLLVSACDEFPTLSGTVYFDGTTRPLPEGKAIALMAFDDPTINSIALESDIVNGQFTFNVVEGSWKVYFVSKDMNGREWYNNAESLESATPISVGCGQGTSITAYVSERVEPFYVDITSLPPQYGRPGELYYYDVEAVIYPQGDFPITYELIQGPDGMTIDAVTGEIRWTPTETGDYRVVVKASIQDIDSVPTYREFASQNYDITVRECSIPGAIVCTFDETNGNGNVMVDLFKMDTGGELRFVQTVFSRRDNPVFNVDPGTYYLYISQGRRLGYFYPNSATIDSATAFVMNCADTAYATIYVGEDILFDSVFVTGSVRLRGTEELVPNGTVTFVGYDEGFGGQFQISIPATNGEYSVILPNQYIYMAYVDFAGERPTVYYPGTTDPMRAEAFWLGNDDAVINFNVPRNTEPRETYQINGSVVNQNNEPLANMIVIAYLISNPADSLEVEMYNGWAGNTNANGTFEIPYLIPGEYVLFAISPAYNYVPGYYLAGQTAVIDWQLATRIQIGRDGSTGPFVITVAPMAEGGQGLGEIGGSIYSGSERGVMSTQGGASSVPVSGASIYAKIEGGSVVKVTSTSSNGAFKFSNLANGTYEIYAGKIGFGTLMNKVTISDENLSAAVNMTMQPGFTPTEEVATSDITIAPNPVSSMMNIKFAATAGTARYTVFNALGEQVAMGAFSTTAGENTHSVDVTGLSAGMYIVRVIGDDVNFSASFSVIR